MNHDIIHCKNSNCIKKDTCYRYLSYQEAMERKLTYISVMVNRPKDKDGCNIYWPIKNN